MDIKDALQLANKIDSGDKFVSWVLWFYGEAKYLGWLTAILFGPFTFWHATGPAGLPRLVVETTDELFFSDTTRTLTSREDLDKIGFILHNRQYKILIFLRILFS